MNSLGQTAEVFNSLLRGPEATKRLSFNNGLLHYTSHVSQSSWCQRTSVCKFQKNNFRKLIASSFFHKTAEFCFDETRCCGKHANICIFCSSAQNLPSFTIPVLLTNGFFFGVYLSAPASCRHHHVRLKAFPGIICSGKESKKRNGSTFVLWKAVLSLAFEVIPVVQRGGKAPLCRYGDNL